MTKKEVGQEIELTELIIDMLQGESIENLEEIKKLLTYHSGFKANVLDGNATVKQILTNSDWRNI